MERYIRELRKEDLCHAIDGWLDEENAERAVTWLIAAETLRPVVLVGSGFSRNATDQRTGRLVDPNAVALWSDVAKCLAGDLGVEPRAYEAPTLFEMYQEALGEAKLRAALRDTVADAHLIPGRAHEALAAYECTAIVTMNCLDTLLDKTNGGRWHRVVEDQDLSATGTARELIYLHGHREQPNSWVMTRGQYEDMPRRKPVMLSRVRQLLAQHPWLVVGYSLTDLDFHAVARLVGLEMAGCQPLSLVLMKDPPTAPERLHWRRLGFEIVTPDWPRHPGKSMADFLEWAIRNLGTNYRATDEAKQAHIERGKTRADRLRRFREVNQGPVVDAESTFWKWRNMIERVMSEEQRERSSQYARAFNLAESAKTTASRESDSPATRTSSAGPEIPSLQEPYASILATPRFSRVLGDVLFWQLHHILHEDALRSEVTNHMIWALDRELFHDQDPRLFLEILTLRIADEQSYTIENRRAIISRLLDYARKYDEQDEILILREEAVNIGFYAHDGGSEERQDYVTPAEKAYRHFLNADFKSAEIQYREAADKARQQERELETWMYLHGWASAGARLADWDPERPKDQQEAMNRDVRARFAEVERLEQGAKVAHWLKQARSRTDSLLKLRVDELSDQVRARANGNQGIRLSSSPHYLWRTYRDIAYVFGSPSLQARYLEPLVPYLESDHIFVVMAHASKQKVWFEDLVRSSVPSLEARRTRDANIVEQFFSSSADSKSEMLSRLECMHALRSVMRAQDAVIAINWLHLCAKRLGSGWVSTARGSSVVAGYWRGYNSIARWAPQSPSYLLTEARRLSELVQMEGTYPGAGGGFDALSELPWSTWVRTDPEAVEGWFQFLCDMMAMELNTPGARHLRSLAMAMFSLLSMLESGLQSEVVAGRLDVWKRVFGIVRDSSQKATKYGESKRAAFLLQRKLMDLGVVETSGIGEHFEDWFGEAAHTEPDRDFDSRYDLLNVLTEVVGDRRIPTALRDRWIHELKIVLEPAHMARLSRNTHLGYAPMRFLVASLAKTKVERSQVEEALLKLVGSSPSNLASLAPVLRSDAWSPYGWSRLMLVLLAGCRGSLLLPGSSEDSGLATRCQLAVLDLVYSADEADLRATSVWRSLESLVLSCCADERDIVANHAGFSVVKLAMATRNRNDAKLYASVLDLMARDPRVGVRLALANGAHRLQRFAHHSAIRDAASRVLNSLATDDNAQVSCVLRNIDQGPRRPVSSRRPKTRRS